MASQKKSQKKRTEAANNKPERVETMPAKPLLTIPEVEAMTGISYPTLYRKWTTGKMPKPIKLGYRTKRFRWVDIKEWIDGGCKSVRSTPKLAK